MQNDSLLQPLNFFYERQKKQPQISTELPVEEIPQPARILLDHKNDMTPTLKSHYQSPITLEVLERSVETSWLFRRVTLRTDSKQPVLYGALAVNLDLLSPLAREDVLACRMPFGDIIKVHNIRHRNNPCLFFRTNADEHTGPIFDLSPETTLFGRVNHMINDDGHTLVRVVEIIP